MWKICSDLNGWISPAREQLRLLENANAWIVSVKGAGSGVEANSSHIRIGVMLQDHSWNFSAIRAKYNKLDRGYTGSGGMPGYIMTRYSTPTEIQSGAAVRADRSRSSTITSWFMLFPFHMNVSVAEYIVVEGLAESSATENFGPEMAGFYVTDLTTTICPRRRVWYAMHWMYGDQRSQTYILATRWQRS